MPNIIFTNQCTETREQGLEIHFCCLWKALQSGRKTYFRSKNETKFESLSMKHLPLLESSSVVKSTAPMEETAARIKLPMITFFLPNLKHKWNTETIIKHFMAWGFLDYRKPFVSFASALSRCCFTTVFIYSFFHQLICWFILSFILILSFIHFFIHLSISSFMSFKMYLNKRL